MTETPDIARVQGAELQLVVFRIGDEEFGVTIDRVREIIPMAPITSIPRAPQSIKGVIDLRGSVIPILDLQERFGIAGGQGARGRIVVSEMAYQLVGCIVDDVNEVLTIPGSSIQPPPPAVSSVESDYLWGVARHADRLIILLDMNRVLAAEERDALAPLTRDAEAVQTSA